jgi:hypothetical protein
VTVNVPAAGGGLPTLADEANQTKARDTAVSAGRKFGDWPSSEGIRSQPLMMRPNATGPTGLVRRHRSTFGSCRPSIGTAASQPDGTSYADRHSWFVGQLRAMAQATFRVIVAETPTAIDADPVSRRRRDVGIRKLSVHSAHHYPIQAGLSFSSIKERC